MIFPDATIHVECLWGVVEHDYTQLAPVSFDWVDNRHTHLTYVASSGAPPFFGCVLSFPHGCGRDRGLVLDPKVLVGRNVPVTPPKKSLTSSFEPDT